MHVVMMNNVFRIIVRLRDDTYPLFVTVLSDMYVFVVHVLVTSMTLLIPLGLAGLATEKLHKFHILVTVLFGLLFIVLGNMAGNAVAFGVYALHVTSSLYVWIIATVVTSVFLWLMRFLGQPWPGSFHRGQGTAAPTGILPIE
jgi:hypothetical protein